MVKAFLYRPVWLPMAIIASMLLLALALLVANAWRGIERLQPVHNHLDRIIRLQETAHQLQKTLLNHLIKEDEIAPAAFNDIRSDINNIIATIDSHSEPTVINSLRQAQQILGNSAITKKQALIEALNQLDDALKVETYTHDRMLRGVRKTANIEFSVATITLVVLPTFVILTLFLIRKRILTPINSLAWLMSQLARDDTTPSPAPSTAEIDPMLKPLIEHYNGMVQRLDQLELEHQMQHDSLESQVRSAATSLLNQQRTLAKAGQLAAVGELAARLAHELRNPLAGMQMAITNLQQEISDNDHIERLNLVARELERVTALLNGLLDQANLRPEPLRTIKLAKVVRELLSLARYQLPEQIRLVQEIPDNLSWRLPENELRRSLLNLILNACHSIGYTAGVIRVSISATEQHLTVEVCDDGPGFSPALLNSGVRSFNTTRVDGTGLGLSAVQRFTQEVHGTMRLHNIEPHGACITLQIPAAGDRHA